MPRCRVDIEAPAKVMEDLHPLLQKTMVASLHQICIALRCPGETLLKHRAAPNHKHLDKHFRARWNRVLINASLDDQQHVRFCTCQSCSTFAAHADDCFKHA